jgi:hypothetical protein
MSPSPPNARRPAKAASADAGHPAHERTAEARAARLMAGRRDPNAAREARRLQQQRVSVLTRVALAVGFAGTGVLAVVVRHESAHATTTANLQSAQLQGSGSQAGIGGVGALQGPAGPPVAANQMPQVVSGGS